MSRYHAPQKRHPPAHEHLHPSNHLPVILRILPSAGSAHSLHYSLRIHDTPLHLDGAEREKYEKEIPRRVLIKKMSSLPKPIYLPLLLPLQ